MTEIDKSASTKIYWAALTMSRAGGEVEAVRGVLDEVIITTKGARVELQGREDLADGEDDSSDWVSLATLDSYDLQVKENGRGKVTGVASYLFDLGMRDGVAMQCTRAVVILAWASEPKFPWRLEDFTFPMPEKWSETKEDEVGWIEIVADGIITYHHAEGIESWWCALPLEALDAKSDVEELLVNPLLAYAEGEPMAKALKPLAPYLLPFRIQAGKLAPRDASPSA